MAETKLWFFPRALGRGYPLPVVERIWEVLEAFASFGFCKAHAAAFALPTYQSAWLKAHWPAHFLAGVLTHDPGMYPKRLILDDARQFGIAVLGLDVNPSEKAYVVERVRRASGRRVRHPAGAGGGQGDQRGRGGPGRRRPALPLAHRLLAPRPGLPAGARAAGPGRRLRLGLRHRVAAGRAPAAARSPGATCCCRWPSSTGTPARSTGPPAAGGWRRARAAGPVRGRRACRRGRRAQQHRPAGPRGRTDARAAPAGRPGVWAKAAAQSQASRTPRPVTSVQLTLDLGDEPGEGEISGLPEMDDEERMKAELEILGLDVSRHVVDTYAAFLDELGITRSRDLLARRSKAELLVAGVKVATQTPPIRSGRRVIFLTLDDATGPVDATFFEDAQGPYAATVFHSWLLVVRGELRRTGRRGVSLRATGAWALPELYALWQSRRDRRGATRRWRSSPRASPGSGEEARRRVLVHSSGFQMSPYSDIKPAGEETKERRPQAVAPQPGERGMTGSSVHALGLAPCPPANAAAPPAPPWCGTALRPVLDGTCSEGRRRPRHRRRHRRVRGPGRRAGPPGPGGRPQPRRPGRPRPARPRARCRRPGHRPAGRPVQPARRHRPRQRRPGAVPRRARGRRRPRRRARHDREVLRPGGRAQPARRPAARRRGGPGDGRPLPAGPGPARRHRTARPAPGAGSPARSSRRCWPAAGLEPTAVHAVRVFADLVPGSLLDLEPGATAPWSSSSRPSPSAPSTSRSPPSSTSSRTR